MDEVCFHWGVWLALLGELSASVVRKCWYAFSLYFISWKLVRGRCSYSNTHPGLELLLSNKDHHFLCLQEWNSWHWRRSKYLLLPVLQLHDFLLYLNCTYVQIALLALPQLLWQLYVHYLTQLKGALTQCNPRTSVHSLLLKKKNLMKGSVTSPTASPSFNLLPDKNSYRRN